MEFTGERIIPEVGACGPRSRIYKEHIARYHFASDLLTNGMAVLDIACGVGYGSWILAQKAKQVSGCDVDRIALEYANKHYSRGNINYIWMDAAELRFADGTFDAIVSFETIEHVLDYQRVLKEFHRTLKLGGLLIISSPNRNTSKGDNQFHFKEFTKDELALELHESYSELEFYSQLLMDHDRLWMRIMRSVIKKGVPLKRIYQRLAEILDARQVKPIPYSVAIDSETQNLIVIGKKRT